MSSGIISLEEARQDAAKNLGQQNPNGFRQKSKMQLLKEQHQLEAAQREQGRRHAMNRWYETSKLVVMDIYNHLGFPMHANAGEKMTMVVGALLQLSAQLIASDKSDPAPLVEAFQHLCKMEVDRVAAEELDIRTQKMAAVVGALIENPDLAKTEGVASPLAALDEPWLGFAKLLLEDAEKTEKPADRKEREESAFASMKDVKVCGEELAATYLRAGIDRFKGMTPEEVVEGWKAIVPELLREKAARETKPEATPVVENASRTRRS